MWTPSFEQWVEYAVTTGQRAFRGEIDDDARFESIDDSVLVTYITQLFESPMPTLGARSKEELANATWFIFGVGSGYFSAVWNAPVTIDAKARCYRSVFKLYQELYDRVCQEDQDRDWTNSGQLDGAVYMIWDMDCIASPVMFPERCPGLVDPGFFVLESTLQKCLAGACLKSALHGLGHLQPYHTERVHSIIDEFLTRRRGAAPWLRAYAEQARAGLVQ